MAKRLILILLVLALANIYVAYSFYKSIPWVGVWWISALSFIFQLLMPLLRFQGEKWSLKRPWLTAVLRVLGVLSLLVVGCFSMIFFFSVVRDFFIFSASFFLPTKVIEAADMISLKLEIMITAGLSVVGLFQALIGPRVRRVDVPLKGLPAAFENFRIVQVSDLHIGPTIRNSYVQNVVKIVNDLKADMIALTGDITDGSPEELSAIAADLSGMQSSFGRFFVTGNHEYYHDALGWMQVHEKRGTHVLTNENFLIEKQGVTLAILGVLDASAHHFVPSHISSPEVAARGIPPQMIKILLAHQPVGYKAAEAAGIHLQLSGHTHSGQFFPWNLVIRFFHDYYRGLNRYKDMWIYVNPGTGYWGPPLRTAVASEITLLTLKSVR